MKKILLVLVFLVVAGGTAGGLYYMGYFTPGASDEELVAEEQIEAELPRIYLPLEPPFVVNFTHRGTLRYLQVSLELMYHEQAVIDKINEQMPAVRNALILLFSNQSYESLSSFEGKEALRGSILLAVNDVIGVDGEIEQPGEAYFTNFVMQ